MTTRTLLLATHNRGKFRELQQYLAELPLVLAGLDSFPSIQPVAEVGDTFTENAELKASGYARQTGLLTLADDSGLQVDALGGAPGVHSARYAFAGASDHDRVSKLLTELSEVRVGKRTARFVSVIAIADESGDVIHVSEGRIEGRIAMASSGSNGFGYDPVFIPNGWDQSFGELESTIKGRISHRAQALAVASDFLRTLTVPLGGR